MHGQESGALHRAVFQQSRRERKKVEMRFAHMKRILRLDRQRSGLQSACDELIDKGAIHHR
jgi:hypothetical protein